MSRECEAYSLELISIEIGFIKLFASVPSMTFQLSILLFVGSLDSASASLTPPKTVP
jgi:hypothetical protein